MKLTTFENRNNEAKLFTYRCGVDHCYETVGDILILPGGKVVIAEVHCFIHRTLELTQDATRS
jgi:hypothetical protein